MPPDEPLRRVDIIPLEELAASANEEGQVKFCRCWKSKTFPLCDNSHLEHNDACADNAAPVIISGFEPVYQQLANNYSVPSTVPPDEPTKRVDMLDVSAIAAQVKADGDVKFCRCWKSANVRAAIWLRLLTASKKMMHSFHSAMTLTTGTTRIAWSRRGARRTTRRPSC